MRSKKMLKIGIIGIDSTERLSSPNRQIIGYITKSKRVAKRILNILPNASYQRIIPSKEAEMVKYFGNCFLAMRVIFAEQIYDLCQALDIDYNLVKEVASHDPGIGQSHLPKVIPMTNIGFFIIFLENTNGKKNQDFINFKIKKRDSLLILFI